MSNVPTENLQIAFPSEDGELTLTGAAGNIQLLVDVQENGGNEPIGIVCHGLPSTGGSIHGRVTHLIDKSFRQLGLTTIRFNFRGVGDSEGEHDHGVGETEDLLTVVNWVRHHNPDAKLWLAGFDFGSYVTARAAQVLNCEHLVSIAPPVSQFDFAALTRPDCHWLVVHGDDDEQTPIQAVQDWVDWLGQPPHLIVMEQAGHKFHRRLLDLRGVIKNGVKRVERLADEQDKA